MQRNKAVPGRVAVLDLGTHTFHLLVADASGKTLYRSRRAVRLGEGAFLRRELRPEAMERGFAALEAYAGVLRRFGPAQMGPGGVMRVIGGVMIGPRERLVLVEVNDTWLVLPGSHRNFWVTVYLPTALKRSLDGPNVSNIYVRDRHDIS